MDDCATKEDKKAKMYGSCLSEIVIAVIGSFAVIYLLGLWGKTIPYEYALGVGFISGKIIIPIAVSIWFLYYFNII